MFKGLLGKMSYWGLVWILLCAAWTPPQLSGLKWAIFPLAPETTGGRQFAADLIPAHHSTLIPLMRVTLPSAKPFFGETHDQCQLGTILTGHLSSRGLSEVS